jgi:CBS-domain-containing membrane protein
LFAWQNGVVTNGHLSVPAATIGSAFTIALVAGVSYLVHAPFLVPPLGATALLCVVIPRANASAPRNVVCSHALALLCGWVALAVSGAIHLPSAFVGGFQPAHVLSAALALGLTVATTERLHVRHPPAGATTLIVGLGVVPDPSQFLAIVGGAALTAYGALLVHRLAGNPYPAWAPIDQVAAARPAPGAEGASPPG